METRKTSRQGYFIVKVAGERVNEAMLDGRLPRPDVDFFVANNRFYNSYEAAEKEAERLARATPGNRYYVCGDFVGFEMPVTALEKTTMIGRRL
jgi:hypothetical protein